MTFNPITGSTHGMKFRMNPATKAKGNTEANEDPAHSPASGWLEVPLVSRALPRSFSSSLTASLAALMPPASLKLRAAPLSVLPIGISTFQPTDTGRSQFSWVHVCTPMIPEMALDSPSKPRGITVSYCQVTGVS